MKIIKNIVPFFKKKHTAEYSFAMCIGNNAKETKKNTTLHKFMNHYDVHIKIKVIEESLDRYITVKHCNYSSPIRREQLKYEEMVRWGFKYAYECMGLKNGIYIYVENGYFGLQDALDNSFIAYCAVQVLWKAYNYSPPIEKKVMFDLEKRKFHFPNDRENDIYEAY
jgi:hypothetical protein